MKAIVLTTAALVCLAPGLAGAQAVALGLSRAQIEDADLVNAAGREIGEVERLVTDAKGAVTGLIVEIDQRDPTPDKLVQIPLAGLKAVPQRGDPNDFDIQTQQTAAQLLALPATRLR